MGYTYFVDSLIIRDVFEDSMFVLKLSSLDLRVSKRDPATSSRNGFWVLKMITFTVAITSLCSIHACANPIWGSFIVEVWKSFFTSGFLAVDAMNPLVGWFVPISLDKMNFEILL